RCFHENAFVLAKQSFDTPQRYGIDIPGIAGNVSHLVHLAVMRRVKPVIHARLQSQRHVAGVAMQIDDLTIAHEIVQRVGKVLDLIELGIGHGAERADDPVARAYEDLWIALDRPYTVPKLADKAIMHASEVSVFRFAQIQIGKVAPQSDRHVPNQWL